FGSMISNLFTLSSAAYQGALEQLHGSEHVQNLRSNLWSMNLLNYALEERVNAGTFSNDMTNNADSIIRRGETTFWASYQGTTGDLEGDIEASGYKITQDGFYAGFDHAISDDILVGFAAGFYRSRLNFTNGSDKDDEGVQLAVYGVYDNQDYYVRGNFAMGYYNADVNRMINLPTQIGVARGDYNVDVMSFHAEAGKRLEVSENVYVTPFAGINYVTAKNKAFSERGTTGANLALPDNKVKSFTGEIGARFAASYRTGSNSVLIPEFFVKYSHEFKDEILSINSSFALAAGSGFSVISSFVDSSSYIVGGGITFSKGDKLDIRLMYTGRFNSQITEHGIGLRLSVLLGDRK
ncbi:MAG: autotransporter outer membrane beta-barrel domain-containing protein, partial [Sphingomonadales bacterium]